MWGLNKLTLAKDAVGTRWGGNGGWGEEAPGCCQAVKLSKLRGIPPKSKTRHRRDR